MSAAPKGRKSGDNELKRTGTGIGHGQQKGTLMLLGESLILKLGTVDGLSTGTIARGKVTTLDHELLNDAVEDGALVVQRLAKLAEALFTGAEGAEVLSRLGDEVGVELHGDATDGLAADGNVEEDAGVTRGGGFGSHGDGLGIMNWG